MTLEHERPDAAGMPGAAGAPTAGGAADALEGRLDVRDLSDAPDVLHAALGSFRSVGGPDGQRWFVREIVDTSYDRRASGSLVFYHDKAMRRVRSYPANWRELPEADLYEVSLGR
ncbi:MAG TPA: hypothetical protein VN706_05285 [Gemmatimonadaceae bacterium]|nr:hypothetical protein [Gemmatimonadaceae bacterium]